jgi:hypothetical protein
LDESVKAQLKKMKDSDPDLNVDYIYNSFLRATPEQKKALEAKFRTNSVRMADLNAK